jgi:NitT/TauT family transport system permease protein
MSANSEAISRTNVKITRYAQSVLLFVVIVTVIEAIIRGFHISPYVVPAPSAVVVRLWELVFTGQIWPHFFATLTSILVGLGAGALAGLVCGALISTIPLLERLVYPYLVAMQTIPKIAIAPLVILWFGFGILSKVVITALLCFFPILVSVIAGFKSVDHNQLEMMKVFGASRSDILRCLRIPSALVIIFAGLEIASVLAVIGAVVGEFVGAQVGLGYLITSMNFNLDVAGMFAVLIFLAVIGLSLHGIVRLARKYFIFWVRLENEQILG